LLDCSRSQTVLKKDLENDLMLNGRPIALKRVDGHAAWVSSEVLRMMAPLPEAVEGGQVVYDEHNNPTGENLGDYL
jgi:hypothetical protein